MPDNIEVRITDPYEFYCFALILNPRGVPGETCSTCCLGPLRVVGDDEGTNHYECDKCGKPCDERPSPNAQIEILIHARSLVDLIHKCSVALCEWQAATSQELMEKLNRYLQTGQIPPGASPLPDPGATSGTVFQKPRGL